MAKDKATGLTDKQKRFADEYLIDLNATRAAKAAGYSEKTAYSMGQQNLKKLEVAAYIDERMQKRQKTTSVTAERIVLEMARMAFYDPADYVQTGLEGPEDIAKLPEEVRRAIVGWKWDAKDNFVIQFADKSKALEQLARHMQLFKDHMVVDLNATVSGMTDEQLEARVKALMATGKEGK